MPHMLERQFSVRNVRSSHASFKFSAIRANAVLQFESIKQKKFILLDVFHAFIHRLQGKLSLENFGIPCKLSVDAMKTNDFHSFK